MLRVWWAIEESADVLAYCDSRLIVQLAGPEAMSRRTRFVRPVDGDDHVAARILTRFLLAHAHPGTLATDWHIEQACDDPLCSRPEPHGRPSGRNGPTLVAVSWAHSSGLIACAVVGDSPVLASSGSQPSTAPLHVGIDAERIGHRPPPIVANWQDWVRVEALVKAGLTHLDEAVKCDFGQDIRLDGTALESLPGSVTPSADERAFIWDLPVPREDIAASLVAVVPQDANRLMVKPELSNAIPLSHLLRHHQAD